MKRTKGDNMQSVGKKFEANWKKSCPDYLLVYRPPDSAQGFDVGASNKLRFSQHSPCDFFMFDSMNRIFYALELKTFQGSCSFERCKEDKGIIHYYQIQSLKDFARYDNVCSGFILDFRKSGNTYFLSITEWDDLINSINKKSFNEEDLLKYCSPILINKKLLRTNYKYDIDKFCQEIMNINEFK